MSRTSRPHAVNGARGLTMLAFALAALSGNAIAQDSTAARSRAIELSRAWAAIGEGDYGRAARVADGLLRRNPSDHAALSVSITATAVAGSSTAALDVYEQWLKRTRHEDVFLLHPVATAALVELGAGADVGLAIDALSKLAGSDPDAAGAALARRTDAGPPFDGVRAALGDTAAVARLTATLAAATSRERLLALRAGEGVADLPAAAITPLLSDPAPPVRAAAIETLARVQGAAAIERLQPLLDDADAYVQATAAVALGRVGDTAGLERLHVMIGSPVADTAAMAALVLKDRGVDVSAVAERILAEPNPLTRLSAIPLLRDPVRAQLLMSEAAADGNPVVRARAGQLVTQEGRDIPTIRRLLRDANAEVRLGAAVALLRVAPAAR